MKYIAFFFLVLLMACAPNRTVNGQREGRWKEVYADEKQRYKSVGRYRHGDEVKRWRHYTNGKLSKVERYRDSVCDVTFYHPNGKVASKGVTRVVVTDKERHWFYSGDWTYFDEQGTPILIRTYKEGNLLGEKPLP